MDCSEPVNGTVTAVTAYNENPILYVVGGQLAEDGKTATVQVAVDGAGIVCGGGFTLSYDTALCTLTEMTIIKDCVAVNPENSGEADGKLRATWAEFGPALDNETILELEFQLLSDQSAPLVLTDVVMKNKDGLTMEGTKVHSGAIGIQTGIQKPVVDVLNTEDNVILETTLYDAKFCGEEKSEGARFMLAAYIDGRMKTVSVPPEAVTFDHNGIAHISLEMPFDEEVDKITLFVLEQNGGLMPLSENKDILFE